MTVYIYKVVIYSRVCVPLTSLVVLDHCGQCSRSISRMRKQMVTISPTPIASHLDRLLLYMLGSILTFKGGFQAGNQASAFVCRN